MSNFSDPPLLMSDEDFEALEEILVSDQVPEDCMDLEMLDGFLAAILISPRPIAPEQWLPAVWSAHGDMNFGGGRGLQRAISLVLAYYNELATTLGCDEGECWEPFCFATGEDDESGNVAGDLQLGDEWVTGFSQGFELWPDGWREDVPEDSAEAVLSALEEAIAPWSEDADEDEDADAGGMADEETRLGWLAAAGETVNDVFARWRDLDLPAPQILATGSAVAANVNAEAGRNDVCPCGSGKKYKKCCGAPRD
ncbi:hypothetical protein AGMMS50225_17090 [Betaproteobacteria bacterium]|nr:hypothetical protein AGMMS50225_17090 [Betaproteobacteria bacterium]